MSGCALEYKFVGLVPGSGLGAGMPHMSLKQAATWCLSSWHMEESQEGKPSSHFKPCSHHFLSHPMGRGKSYGQTQSQRAGTHTAPLAGGRKSHGKWLEHKILT